MPGNLLARIPLFSDLPVEELEKLVSTLDTQELESERSSFTKAIPESTSTL